MKLGREVGRRGEPTVTINGRYLHSPYSARAESSRFLETLDIPHEIRTLIIIGDGLGVVSAGLAETRPGLNRISIEVAARQEDLETHFCPVAGNRIPAANLDRTAIRPIVRALIHPTEIGGVQLITWPAIDRCDTDWRREIELGIRDALRDLRSELATIAHFGRLWMSNALRATLLTDRRSEATLQGEPLYLAASGPTIEDIPAGIRPVAVSSALRSLRSRGVEPLLVLHTDGGTWARRYLSDLRKLADTVLGHPLRTGRAPVEAPLLLSDGSILDELAPDAPGWRTVPDQPSVGIGLIDLVRRMGDAEDIRLVGLDLCSRDLILHARPHHNDRFVASASMRVSSEHNQRYARLSPQATGLHWHDGARAYHSDSLEAFVGPLRHLLDEEQDRSIAPITPSPVWEQILQGHSRRSNGPRTTTGARLVQRIVDRPERAARQRHASGTLARWRDVIRSSETGYTDGRRDLLLYLAPVEFLADQRNGGASAIDIAMERLDRITGKAGVF